MNPKNLAGTIRERAAGILDSLPMGETFNWVERVSIVLTGQMLATLFDMPIDDRLKLSRWSDVGALGIRGGIVAGLIEDASEYHSEMQDCLDYFTKLWNERIAQPPRNDLISMLAHGESTRHMSPQEFLGNLILLIVGGNDTTRNSISGGVLALNQSPAEYDKLRADTSLIPNMVSEIIRYQTPLAHMRRTATADTELGGKLIRQGDKVIMWYLSGNRDDSVIERADEFLIDRAKARQHLSFGFGVHRCMGNRLAEMQLRILWEEIMARFEMVEVVGEPVRVPSNFIHGFTDLPVRVHPL
jgi:cytochrome P450